MEAAAEPSSQRQRTSSGGGGGRASMNDLPDVLLSHIFGLTSTASVVGPSATLVCQRWHRQFYATSSLWRHVDVFEPQDLTVEQRETWLAAKLRKLRRVAPAVESLQLCDAAGLETMEDVLHCLRPEVLQKVDTGSYDPPVTQTAMRALQRMTQLTYLSMG